MKLIDLLVQELPKRGGWPRGAATCERFLHESHIDFYDEQGNWPEDCGKKYGFSFAKELVQPRQRGRDFRTEVVKKDEYEAALAASRQVAWNGDGLPPVGCWCEFFNGDRYDCRDSVPKDGTKVKVVAHDKSEIGTEIAVFTWTGMDGALHAEACTEMLFRPIRTEAERRREEVVAGIQDAFLRASDASDVGQVIWEHIAESKIPGIKLAD